MGRRMRGRLTRVLLLLLVAGWVQGWPAEAAEVFLPRGAVEMGVRTGYNFEVTKNARMVTTTFRLGYALWQVDGKERYLPSFFPRGTFELAVEPFASAIFDTETTAEAGGAIVPTYYFDTGTRLLPYIEGGVGAMYTSLSEFNLGGKFQFLIFGEVGLSYFLTDRMALRLGGRFRHISNASTHKNNAGLDSVIVAVGFSYFLPR